MRQTIAIFIDAYRDLNAKKLFWVVLGLSGLVVLVFLGVGLNDRGISLFGLKTWPSPMNAGLIPKALFYKTMFLALGVAFWLTWAATILALISTAGLFPDMLTGGAIDLYLSKPISRLRLFITKYLAGLAFVFLQVLVFSAASFLVLGIRGGTWEPGVFLAVPVVVVFFSYLYCVCVLVGVLTRSTIAAVLLTGLFWMALLGVHAVESAALHSQIEDQLALERFDRVVAQRQLDLHDQDSKPPSDYREARRRFDQQKIDDARDHKAKVQADLKSSWHPYAFAVKTVLPKTSETVALLNRWLTRAADLRFGPRSDDSADDDSDTSMPGGLFGRGSPDARKAAQEMARTVAARSVWWVAGTSLGFEAVIVAGAAWVFCRRDY